MRRMPSTIVAALATGLVLGAGASASAPGDRADGITLPVRARLKDVVRELSRQRKGVCIADATDAEPVLARPIEDARIEDALARISRELDRFWLRKGQVLILQRRFTDPEEDPEVELEEVKAVVSDLFRLISPFVRRRLDEQHIRDQNRFVDALTPEQQRAMGNGGLSLAQLPEAQRNAWLELNLAHAYVGTHLEVERAARCLENWNTASLNDLRLKGKVRQDFGVVFKHPTFDGGGSRCRISVPGAGRSAPNVSEGFDLPPHTDKLPGDLKPTWDIPAEEVTLGQLVDRLSQAGGPQVRVPTYARERRLWIASQGGSRAEVLDAVGLLWGWNLTTYPESGYRLERPRLPLARNPLELHDRMLRAIPPSLLHHLRLRDKGGTMRRPRQMALVVEAADRAAGRNWVSVPVSKLDPMVQRRLANCVAITQLGTWFTNHGRGPAPAWLTHPERGVLTLGAPVAGDNHPLLKFSVFKEDGGRRTEEFWGWYVNTSSLFKREGPGQQP